MKSASDGGYYFDGGYDFEGTLIQYLFRKIDDAYRGRFIREFGAKTSVLSAEYTWADALDNMGITEMEAKVALNRINQGEEESFRHPPNLPEFIQLCRPKIDYQAAFQEAVKQIRLRADGRDGWSHPAIFWAAITIGVHDLNYSTWKEIKPRWTEVLKSKLKTHRYKPVPKSEPVQKLEYKISDEEKEKNKGRLSRALKGAIKKAA